MAPGPRPLNWSGLQAAAAMVILLMGFASVTSAEEPGDVVAKLGQTEFDAPAFQSFIRSLDPALRKQAAGNPDLMNRLVGLELARIAVLNEAKAKNWQARPDVARRIDRAKDDAIFASYMAEIAAVPKNYPSEAEIASAYDSNRDTFLAPRQYRLEQIFVSAPANLPAQAASKAEAKAKEIARLARARIANFAALAKSRSEHRPSAESGGDLGWATEAQIVPEIRAVVPGMEVGEVSEPIRTQAGWHVVRLAETRPAGPKPLAEVKDQLSLMLRQKKLQENQEAFIARLIAKSPVAVNEARLKKLFESQP